MEREIARQGMAGDAIVITSGAGNWDGATPVAASIWIHAVMSRRNWRSFDHGLSPAARRRAAASSTPISDDENAW